MTKAQKIITDYEEADFTITSLEKRVRRDEQTLKILTQTIKDSQSLHAKTGKNLFSIRQELGMAVNKKDSLKQKYPKAVLKNKEYIRLTNQLNNLLG